MNHYKKILITFCLGFFVTTNKALADLAPLPGEWQPSSPTPTPKQDFLDVIEPIHLIIGGVVVAVIIVSFIIILKIRNK